MEKNRQVKITITQLRTDDGEIEKKDFYSNLYKSNNPDKDKVNAYIKNC